MTDTNTTEQRITWSSLYYSLGGAPQRQALLVATAWMAAANSQSAALLSNLLCNTLHPTGVFQVLDYSGVPLPECWDTGIAL